MPSLRGIAPTSRAHVDVAEGGVGVVGLHHAGQQREGAVLELHGHAAQALEGGVISSICRMTGWSGPSIEPEAIRKSSE